MFYNNLIDKSHSKTINKKINTFKKNINTEIDSEILDFSEGCMCYNFDLSNGVLKDGVGLNNPVFEYNLQMYRMYKSLEFPENYHIYGCWYFPYWNTLYSDYSEMIIIYCSNKRFYYNYLQHPSTQFIEISSLEFEDVPMVMSCKIDDLDTLVLVSKTDGMYTWNFSKGAKKIENAPVITSMCIQFNRMFVTTDGEKRSVLYSDNLNPTNFNTQEGVGGIIEMNDEFGLSNKVVPFKNYVYVFRDYNIAKIASYADEDYFSVSQLYVSNGKILSGTICACGSKIIYLASDGLYEFDGNKSTKLELNIDNLFQSVDNDLAVAGYSNGHYYLACRMNFNDGVVENDECKDYVNNSLLKYNVSSGEFSILRGYDIRQIVVIPDSIDNYLLAIFNDKNDKLSIGAIDMSGNIYGEPTHKVWKSAVTDFGHPTRNKVLKEVSFDSLTDGELKIVCDNITKSYHFVGREGIQKVKPYLKGKKFSISFHVNKDNCRIVKPVLKVGILC